MKNNDDTIEALEAKLAILKHERRQGIIARIQAAIKIEDITQGELFGGPLPRSQKMPARSPLAKAAAEHVKQNGHRRRRKMPPRQAYVCGDQRWSGFGKVPQWLKNEMESSGEPMSAFEER